MELVEGERDPQAFELLPIQPTPSFLPPRNPRDRAAPVSLNISSPEYFELALLSKSFSWIFWRVSSCTRFSNISKIHQCPSSISWIFGSCRFILEIIPSSWHRCYPTATATYISRIELLANWSILNLALSFFETWNSGWWRFEANQPGNVPDYQVGQ